MSIVIRTLSERVFEIVREQIVNGKLPVDTAIRQDALASELGVSKIPLREALVRLEQEGLLVSHANRGYFVQPMSSEQAEEIYALRLSIEPQAAAFAARRAEEEDRKQAKLAYQRLESAANSNLADVAVRNRDFHIALVRPGQKLLTTQLVEKLAVLAERYVIAHLEPAGRDARAHREHRTLFNAWMAGDAREVQKLLKAHIQGTLDDLRSQFNAGG
jgi:DNA-binding GntR family transcriptional regulator